MPDNPQIEIVAIRSNTDAISGRAVHDSLVNMLRDELLMGEAFLAGIVPKRSGDMAEHVGHRGPDDAGEIIDGSVGIPEIHKSDESDPFSAKYPLFVDKGTGIFGEHGTIFPKEKHFMYLPPERGGGTEYPRFLSSSEGQAPRGFMLETFAFMSAWLKVNGEIWKSELAAKLNADKLAS